MDKFFFSFYLFSVEEIFDKLLDLRDTGAATDEDNLVNLVLAEVTVLEDLLDRLERSLEQVHVELLKLGAGKSLAEVLAVNERLDLETGLVSGRERTLGLLALTSKLLHRALVLGQVLAHLLLDKLDEVLHDTLVKVLTTQMGVAGGSNDLKDAVVNGEERHVEGTTAQVEHDNVLLAFLLVQSVRNGRRSRLVDDTHHSESRNCARVLGSLALSVVKVRRHSHDGVRHLLAKVLLGGFLLIGLTDLSCCVLGSKQTVEQNDKKYLPSSWSEP